MKDVHEEENYKISAGDLETKVQLLLSRPARRQIDPEEKKKLHWIPEGATEYNIWYDRWVGEHWRADKDHGQLCQLFHVLSTLQTQVKNKNARYSQKSLV